jgi:hypothetical protein
MFLCPHGISVRSMEGVEEVARGRFSISLSDGAVLRACVPIVNQQVFVDCKIFPYFGCPLQSSPVSAHQAVCPGVELQEQGEMGVCCCWLQGTI